MSTTDWLRSTVHGALADALALVLPVACAGCDEPDIALCEDCIAQLHPHVSRSGAIWSGLVFEGVTARVVRALKEDGRTGLARHLAPALRAAVDAALDAASRDLHAGSASAVAPILVPIPTSRAAYRRRGYRVVELVARRAGLRCSPLLVPARVTADQRGLDRAGRRHNMREALVARQAAGLRVVVIDDVVTTGATLKEAMRALQDAGAEVLGAATVAATPRRRARG